MDFIRDMYDVLSHIDGEPYSGLCEMATVGYINIGKRLCIKVGVDSDLGNHNCAYFKLYSGRNIDTAKLIRVSFLGNECFVHRGHNDFWKPSDVPFEEVTKWFKQRTSPEPSLTNWQYAMLMWNRESGFWISTEDFCNGSADAQFGKIKKNGSKEHPRYVPFTAEIPTWDAQTMIYK